MSKLTPADRANLHVPTGPPPAPSRSRRRGWSRGLIALVLLVPSGPAVGQAADEAAIPSIRIRAPRGGDVLRSRFEVVGLDREVLVKFAENGPGRDGWNALFTVRSVGKKPLEDVARPPLPGRYEVVAEILRFTPDAPLEPGGHYRADLDLSQLIPGREVAPTSRVSALFSLPRRDARSAPDDRPDRPGAGAPAAPGRNPRRSGS